MAALEAAPPPCSPQGTQAGRPQKVERSLRKAAPRSAGLILADLLKTHDPLRRQELQQEAYRFFRSKRCGSRPWTHAEPYQLWIELHPPGARTGRARLPENARAAPEPPLDPEAETPEVRALLGDAEALRAAAKLRSPQASEKAVKRVLHLLRSSVNHLCRALAAKQNRTNYSKRWTEAENLQLRQYYESRRLDPDAPLPGRSHEGCVQQLVLIQRTLGRLAMEHLKKDFPEFLDEERNMLLDRGHKVGQKAELGRPI